MKNLFKLPPKKAEDIYYSDANIYLNGKLITPSAPPLFSDDAFYIPIDFLNETQKNKIYMDEKNIFIGTPPSKKEPINTVCPPFLINAEIKDIYTIGNKEYKNIVLFKTTNKIHASVTYKINSLYEKISFDLINLKEITDKDAYFAVMTDYDTIIEKKLITLDTKTAFEVNLKNINYLKFFFISNYNDISFMIANIVTE